MLTRNNVAEWTPSKVRDWIAGLCEDASWLKSDFILENNIGGKRLLMMAPQDLEEIGATKVNLQEHILEAIGNLRYNNFNLNNETVQKLILNLACQSRSLYKHLTKERASSRLEQGIELSSEFKDSPSTPRQKISLNTLISVSSIATIVIKITDVLNRSPFSKNDDCRSMKSLILALSIELTSTAQRDQFVERPNDIIERCSKKLADYCDRIVLCTTDPVLFQPIQLESSGPIATTIKSTT